MRRLFLLLAATTLVPATICAGACGSDGTPAAPSPPPDTSLHLAEVVYEGGATDEALIALLSVTPKSDPAHAAVFSSPANGATLPADPAPKLSWHLGGATGRLAPPAEPGGARARASAPAGQSVLRRLLSAVPAAQAHGAPINGRAYYLVFSTAKSEGVLRVFTTRLDYTPDAAAWAKLRAAGGMTTQPTQPTQPTQITVTALNAVFENNRVAAGEASSEGEPVTFTIQL